MKKILIIISFFLLFCSKTYAETVKEIIVSGNKRVSEETIKVYGEIEINKDYQDSDLNNIVRNLFSTDFFEDVNVTLNNNVLKINVKEYPVINQLVFVGEKSNRYIEQIKKSIKLKQKGSFIKSKLPKDIETIKTLYSSLGYNFSKIEPKGEFTLIIEGNNKVKEHNTIDIKNELIKLISAGLSHSAASIYLSKKLSIPKNEIYKLLINKN